MLSTLDAADRAAVERWIVLLDVVLQRQRDPRAYQTRGGTLVASAIDALLAYEHQLPAYLRLVARETLWRRDCLTTLLPSGRDWWADCQCRACLLQRRRAQADRRVAVYEVQLAAVRRQRSYPDTGAGDEQFRGDDHVVL